MAKSNFDKFTLAVMKQIELEELRRAQLSFSPKILQEWIVELQDKNKQLTDENIKLHKELGSTCFNPVQI